MQSKLFFIALLIALSASKQDPCSLYIQNNTVDYSAWMNDLMDLNPLFGDQKLSTVLVGGAHDAGLSKVTQRNPLGRLLKHSAFVTQSHSVLGQLCTGARFFDLRFKWRLGVFY
eukprot:TRINITY_DN1602_c2_g1_i2.p1 TRINITY_DN1602_c2_g1~~TRINITY_DN1602_c2_g1_i2.p1  ORF type:complete len:114 (-),score=12.73 TRINITY_DN1602_c2_g1_i2:121-462(-)